MSIMSCEKADTLVVLSRHRESFGVAAMSSCAVSVSPDRGLAASIQPWRGKLARVAERVLATESAFACRAAAQAQAQNEALACDDDGDPRGFREPSGRSVFSVVYVAGLLVLLWIGVQFV